MNSFIPSGLNGISRRFQNPTRAVARLLAAAAFVLLAVTMGAGPTLADTAPTASFHGLPDGHNGKKLFAFEIRFSGEFDGLRLTALKRALEVTGGRIVDVKRTVRGENQSVTVRVRPSSSGEMTLRLGATTDCSAASAMCTRAGDMFSASIAATVAGPATASAPPPSSPPPSTPPPSTPPPSTPPPATSEPLTATFHGVPTEHDGKKLFAFEIHFSEEFDGMRLTALKRSLLVSGGRIVDVKRTVRGQNRRVTVRVRPSSHDPVIVALPSTLDCTAAGAICAKDGRKLSTHASMTVTSPAWGPGESLGSPYTPAALRSLNLHPQRSQSIETSDSSSAPAGLPSTTGSVVNMHNVGQLRERSGNSGAVVIDFPCGNPDMDNVCRIGGGG